MLIVLAVGIVVGFAAYVIAGATTNTGTTGAIGSENARIMAAERASCARFGSYATIATLRREGLLSFVPTFNSVVVVPGSGLRDDRRRLSPTTSRLRVDPRRRSREGRRDLWPPSTRRVPGRRSTPRAASTHTDRGLDDGPRLDAHTGNTPMLGMRVAHRVGLGHAAVNGPRKGTVRGVQEAPHSRGSPASSPSSQRSSHLLGEGGSAAATGTTFYGASNTQPAFDFMTQDFVQNANGGQERQLLLRGLGPPRRRGGRRTTTTPRTAPATLPPALRPLCLGRRGQRRQHDPGSDRRGGQQGSGGQVHGRSLHRHELEGSGALLVGRRRQRQRHLLPRDRIHPSPVHDGPPRHLLVPEEREDARTRAGRSHLRGAGQRLLRRERHRRGSLDDGRGLERPARPHQQGLRGQRRQERRRLPRGRRSEERLDLRRQRLRAVERRTERPLRPGGDGVALHGCRGLLLQPTRVRASARRRPTRPAGRSTR